MAIYIGTKRIDGGGSSDPSIVRVYYPSNIDISIFDSSKLNNSAYVYNLPMCSSINYISPIGLIEDQNSPIGKVIVNDYYNSYQFINVSKNNLDQMNFDSDMEFPGGISIYNTYAALFSSETGFPGDSGVLKIYPNWETGSIFCELTDGIHNTNNSSDLTPGLDCYYSDCYRGELQPLLYTSKFDTGESIGYPNTILDLTNADFSTTSGTINVTYSEAGVSNIIVRETANFSGIIVAGGAPGYKILYGPNFEENAVKGSTGDPSIIVCYSFLTIPDSKLLLVNAAQYKEA